MNRTTVTLAATLVALILLAGTSVAGFTATPILQQDGQPLDINVWLAETGSTDLVRRLDSDVTEAQIVVQSNLRERDPNRFRVEAVDASGNVVFQSGELMLPTGAHTESVPIQGKDFFQAYVNRIQLVKDDLAQTIDNDVPGQLGAIQILEQERAKDPCTFDPNNDNPSLRTNPARVAERVNATQGPRETIESVVQRLLSFDSLENGARTDLNEAQTALDTVFTRGQAAIDKLQVPEDAPLCPEPLEYGIEIPNWEPDWDSVLGDLNAMLTAANTAEGEIDGAVAGVDQEADRNFPPTGVEGRCNQNTVQLRVASSGAISADAWWTVGTPSDVAVLANPQDPADTGLLLPGVSRIFAQNVAVAGAPHSTLVQALAVDELCLPVEGATVNFSTPAGSIVTLDQSEATTDGNGVASVTVDSTSQLGEDGTATINAAAGSAIASTTLTVVGPPDRVNLLLGGSELSRIPNYGVESTIQVTTEVKDEHNFDVADGTAVNFSIDPTDHHVFSDSEVTTATGQASATLVFGQTTGPFTINVQAGSASDAQEIRVVGRPDTIEVTAQPSIISVDQVSVDDRSSTLTVTVHDSEGNWAPDSTMVEFEFVDPEDANWAYFTLRPDNLGQYRTPITDGTATTQLVGSPTNLQNPSERLSYREVTVRVTAVYEVGGVETSVSDTVTVKLRGQIILLPLVRRSGG